MNSCPYTLLLSVEHLTHRGTILLQAHQNDHKRRAKRNRFIFIAATAAAIFTLSELRFVTDFNDAISGPPDYMRHIGTAAAKELNVKLSRPSPILLARDEARPAALCSAKVRRSRRNRV